MTYYLISFPSVAMRVPASELPAVSDAAAAVIHEAQAAGVYVFGGGIDESIGPVRVAADGAVSDGAHPETVGLTGGFTVLDLPTRDAAVAWAAKIATACRCEQEIREFGDDPRR